MSLTPARGRPRKKESLPALIERVGREHRDGASVTRLEEVVNALYNMAIDKDAAAARLILAYIEGTPIARAQAEVSALPPFRADEAAEAARRVEHFHMGKLTGDSQGSQSTESSGAT